MNGEVRKIPCDSCSIPVAEIKGNVVIIRVKHYGEVHETRIILVPLDINKMFVVS